MAEAEPDQNEGNNFDVVIFLENEEIEADTPAPAPASVTVELNNLPSNSVSNELVLETAETTDDILRYFLQLKLTPNDILKIVKRGKEENAVLFARANELVRKVKRQNHIVAKLYKLYLSELEQIEQMKNEFKKVDADLVKEKEQNSKLAFLVDELKKRHRKLLLEPDSNYLIQREMEVQRKMENRRVMADPSISKLKDEHSRLEKIHEKLEKNLAEKNEEFTAKKLEFEQFRNVSGIGSVGGGEDCSNSNSSSK